MADQPYYKSVSFLTSTTAISFLLVTMGALAFAFSTKNTDLMIKLVDMVIPAYLMSKGVAMGQPKTNGGDNGTVPKPLQPV